MTAYDDSGGTKVLKSPEQPSVVDSSIAILVQIYPPGQSLGRRFALDGDEHIVGRLDDVDFPLAADSVSRRHARLFRKNDAWHVEDLGSTNGCLVNDEKITTGALRDGDQVRFGDMLFKFLAGDNVETAYHEEIYRMSILDGLTGIHNRRYLMEFVQRELARAVRHKMPLALVMFDIDHFKQVNDTHGHLIGDAVLKELCRRIKPRIRREDLFARYGGEEFTCVLPDTDLAGARKFAEALRMIVERDTFDSDDASVQVTVSLGAATGVEESVTPESLILAADEKLFEAKRLGRNRVVV